MASAGKHRKGWDAAKIRLDTVNAEKRRLYIKLQRNTMVRKSENRLLIRCLFLRLYWNGQGLPKTVADTSNCSDLACTDERKAEDEAQSASSSAFVAPLLHSNPARFCEAKRNDLRCAEPQNLRIFRRKSGFRVPEKASKLLLFFYAFFFFLTITTAAPAPPRTTTGIAIHTIRRLLFSGVGSGSVTGASAARIVNCVVASPSVETMVSV